MLSNILLNDLDQELQRRQLAFCRYADDCNIYVRSRVAGERVMSGVRALLEGALKLRINAEKSSVARPWKRKFLGFSVTAHRESRLRIAPASVQRLMQKVRDLMRAGRGRSLAHTIEDLNPLLRGWINYFRLTESKGCWRNWMVGCGGDCAACCGDSGSVQSPERGSYAPWGWAPSVRASALAMVMVRGGTRVRLT